MFNFHVYSACSTVSISHEEAYDYVNFFFLPSNITIFEGKMRIGLNKLIHVVEYIDTLLYKMC